MPISRPIALLTDAISFAARAHRHQTRKDGITPYFSHPVRVCMVIRHVFGVDDLVTLTAAVLHDTIEDTTTDYDDIIERFGAEVADCVAALSKDMRLPNDVREPAYLRQLVAGNWRVALCKLGDTYDNLSDFSSLLLPARQKQLGKAEEYLHALSLSVPEQARAAFEIVVAQVTALREAIG